MKNQFQPIVVTVQLILQVVSVMLVHYG